MKQHIFLISAFQLIVKGLIKINHNKRGQGVNGRPKTDAGFTIKYMRGLGLWLREPSIINILM